MTPPPPPPSTRTADPTSVGIDPDRLAELVERTRRDVRPGGPLPAAAIAVARHGRVVCHEVLGDAEAEARFNLFSITKAVVAAAAWRLMSEDRLSPADRVVAHVPEFGTNGKDVVTVEHLLTHTAGFPHAPLGPPHWYERERRLEHFAEWHLNWEPGTQMEYHASSAHWVLAEIIERLAGDDFRDAIHETVCQPLGLDRLRVGATARHPDDWADVPTVEMVGEAPDPAELEALIGIADLDLGEISDDVTLRYNDPRVRDLGVPGGGGIGTAADVALFYQALLHDPAELWDADVLADATSRVRHHFEDPMLGIPANRTLGLVVAGDDGHAARRGFGKTVSARTFGHFGLGAQVAWADPESGISFCFVTNGHEVDLLAQGRRIHGLNNRAGALAD